MSNFTKLKLCHTFGISQSTHIWVKGALTALLLVLCGNGAKAQSDVKFNDGVRYSQWVIDSRIGDFYGNQRGYGFTTYNDDLTVKKEKTKWIDTDGKSDYPIQVDYVAGLVAKATIEAAEYYKNFDWSKPWFKSVEWYGNKCTVDITPDNLDAINASKMYFGIYNLATVTFKGNAESNTASNATKQLGYALTALSYYNSKYAFPASTTLNDKDITGGWYHKSSYSKQMWLDGQYMGPATLAQLINGYSSYSSNKLSDNDWNLITKQFTIVWEQCWDSNAKLLYHAFSSEKLSYWTSNADIWDTAQTDKTKWTSMTAAGHSAAFWGRAEGWYFLALVDVLEQMKTAGQESTNNYSTLLNYLTSLADGIKKRQDATTGCWYQLVGKEGGYKASYYNGKSANEKSNYLESSCTAIFTAAYLKAIRLGLLPSGTYLSIAEKAYKGMVKQFMKQRTDGTVDLLGCCKSAGLGTKALKDSKFRDGSNAYYLHGYDVTPTSTNDGDDYTEGKVLGAFILAATEYEREYQKSMLLSKDLNSTYNLNSNEPLTVEVLGDGEPTYQWYDAATEKPIENATNASYTPTQSGKYCCKITVKSPSTAAKTRTASTTYPYTITTNTADVTVPAATTTYTVTFDAGSNGTCSTPSLTQSSANANITLPSVTPNTGYTFIGWYDADGNVIGGAGATYAPKSDITLYAHYTATGGENGGSSVEVTLAADGQNKYRTWTSGESKVEFNTENAAQKSYVKLSKNDTGTFTVPSGCTITKIVITYGTSNNVGNMTTTATLTLPSTSSDGKFTVTQNADGTVTVTATDQVYIRKAVVTYTTGSGSTEPTPSTDASATFTYNGSALSFTDYVATINLGSSQANSDITVNATPATGATITTSSENTSVADNVITITTPAAGSSASYAYTVKSQDGTKTQTYTINVNVAAEVVGKEYSLKVTSSSKTPKCNESWYITGADSEKLVKMTFGGWKWGTNDANNDHSYEKPHSKDVITDLWNAPAKQDKVTALDGYEYAITGKYDAVHEDKTATTEMYGKTRYGWFVSPERVNGITTKSFPFTLPVRGAYMTFEPTKNGTLTIYLLQNGAWNSDNNNDIIPGEFRMHAFQITNQRGLVLEEFAPQYKITVNQKVMDGYTCSQYTNDPGTGKYDNTSKDISNWEEFWALTYNERKAVHDNWDNGEGSQTIIKLDNGSFLAIQKAIVKYQFHVTGNETYYMFSNFSKLGFSGATFQPDDAQPTDETTFSGDNSLSDTKKFTKIMYEADGTTISGTEMVNYKYTIDGKEVGKVAGVFIPQFKKITLNRTFKAGQWTTLTLPFNLTEEEVQTIFGDGTRLVMLKEGTIKNKGARLTFIYHEIQNVLPGYPYLIKPKKDVNSFTANNKCINPHITQYNVDCGDYWHKGTPDYSTAVYSKGDATGYSIIYPENDIFVSEGNGNLYVSSGASYGKGYRSWIAKKTVAEGGTSQTAKSISVVMSSFSDDDDTTTSIDVAEMAPDLIEALGIQTGVYNLSGQRVANDTRNLKAGIYIVNGKKTVVR